MKLTRLYLLAAMLTLLCGCTNVPSQDATRIKAAWHSYLSVGKGASHAQVVAVLGNESRRGSDGAYYWETRYDSLNYASIRIHFDSSDRVQDTNVTRAWGVQDSHSQADASVEREK
jgi:hypothetical protein